jgi:hypothetical protein
VGAVGVAGASVGRIGSGSLLRATGRSDELADGAAGVSIRPAADAVGVALGSRRMPAVVLDASGVTSARRR